MRGDSPRNVHTNSGYFPFLHRTTSKSPNAGPTSDTLCMNTIVTACADQNLFKFADVFHGAKARIEAAQIENGIANQLARSVIGHITTTIDLVYFHTTRG